MKRHSGEKSRGRENQYQSLFAGKGQHLVEATFLVKVIWRRRRMEEKEWNWNGELCEGARRGELGGGGSRKMNMRTELDKREGERRRRRRRSRRRRRRGEYW